MFVYNYVREKGVVRFKFQVESSQMCGGRYQGNSCSRIQSIEEGYVKMTMETGVNCHGDGLVLYLLKVLRLFLASIGVCTHCKHL